MALQAVLDSVDNLDESLQKEYKKGEDGKYHLELTGLDSHVQIGALYRARDHEKTEKNQFKTQLTEQKAEVKRLQEDLRTAQEQGNNLDHKKRADDWERKYNEDIAAKEADLKAASQKLSLVVEDSKAEALAGEWFTSVPLTKDRVKSRLKAEILDNGEVIHRVLDKDGNMSAMSIDDLKAEMIADPAYAPVAKAGGGSGSADNSSGKPGEGGNNGGSASGEVDLASETPQQTAERRKAAREAKQR